MVSEALDNHSIYINHFEINTPLYTLQKGLEVLKELSPSQKEFHPMILKNIEAHGLVFEVLR